MVRIGLDIVDVHQLERSLQSSSTLVEMIFSSSERSQAADRKGARFVQYMAGRLAVKEAVLKALRVPLNSGVELFDIEALSTEDGAPQLKLYDSALEAAAQQGLHNWQVSISHERTTAIAVVIAIT